MSVESLISRSKSPALLDAEDKELSSRDQATLRDLNKKRGAIKAKLTLFVKFVESFASSSKLSNREVLELKLRHVSAELLLREFNSIQSKIEDVVSESEFSKQLESREMFENSYYAIMSEATNIIDSNSENTQESHRGTSSLDSHSLVKLPVISLPTFDGSYDTWLEFRDTFMSMIHLSKRLDNIQKFHYLRSALSGNAIQVIHSLEFSSENYTIAWELLNNRYNNTKLLVHNHVKALFSLQSITKESPSKIRKMVDTVNKTLRALNILGEPTEHWDTLVIFMIVSKLDPTVEKEWEQFKTTIATTTEQKIDLETLLTFLQDKANMLEMIKSNHSSSTNRTDSEFKKSTQKVHSLVTTQPSNKKSKRTRVCIICEGNHALYSCSKFLNLSIKDRLHCVQSNKLCKNCLREGHAETECYFGPCKTCNKKHNSLLHSECDKELKPVIVVTAPLTRSPPDNNNSDSDTETSTTLHTHTQNQSNSDNKSLQSVLLSTALIEVSGGDHTYITARALLDSGSQHCIITNSLSNKLNALPIQSTTYEVTGVGQSITRASQSCEIKLKSKHNKFNTRIKCLVLPTLTSTLPTAGLDVEAFKLPDNITLADPLFRVPSQIDILIGADQFWDLLEDGRIRLPNGPCLQNTKLGWIVSGPVHTRKNRLNKVHCNFLQTVEINEQLKKFWELEEIPQNNNYYSQDELACEKIFVETTKREENGRFSVRIPLNDSLETLGDSYEIAKKRLISLERKLDKSPTEYKQMYCDFMQEYIDLGHMSRIENFNSPYYFLPHHGVFRENSITTKLRVVFDASQATTSGVSLNDVQLPGPPLQNDLLGILLRFRQYKYVACADIEKMFWQINIQNDLRNLQLILWRSNPTESISVYQLNTVTYGTASAPYLSMRCVRQLGMDCTDDHTARTILNDFYVDDLITGCDSKSQLATLCKNVTEVCASGCLPLRKWTFNASDIADQVLNASINESKYLSLSDSQSSKTLGLGWFNKSDEFHFTSKVNTVFSDVTKRIILSVVSQIYDPLGLLSPIVIVAKVLLQLLWVSKVDWDDSVPTGIHSVWMKFVNSLSNLQTVRVPRHVIGDNPTKLELHIFTDASEKAYGACAYIRTCDREGRTTVRLLCSKSRVAPVKPVSIPRLELCGALVGAKLLDKIVNTLRVSFDCIVMWTDSSIVLGWLKTSPNLLKTFVQNRVVEITDITNDNAIWLHVDGKVNPADLLSRGTTLDELIGLSLWWNGPDFLHEKVNKWSNTQNHNTQTQNTLPELKINTTSHVCTENMCNVYHFEKFSSYRRLQRVCAYVQRFIHNCRADKTQRKTSALSVSEINNSTQTLIRIVQRESFQNEYNDLLNKKSLKSTRKLSSLNVFLDEKNLIRVGGRLFNSNFSYNKKHPLLLCSKHYVTQLIFRDEHINLLHAGPQLLLARIRSSWWPLGGRNLARKTVHQCVRCSRITCKPPEPIMGDLPKERLELGFPFMTCGVDYAGPMYILNRKGRGAKLEKCYLCLFVCFATRAVHLELVTCLSSEGYIMALKRFISRRGKPKQIYSDHGRNFVGAVKEFSDFIQDNSQSIIDYATNNQIEFKFILPYAPHFGGLWEAGVKSCKHHIVRVIGNSHLTYEEFSTVLTQVEAILNSRPLYPMSPEPDDCEPLTPAHFLIGRPLTAPCGEDITTRPLHSLTRYKRVEQLRQHFWKRWSTEYIVELQRRTKWKETKSELLPNTLVVVREDNLPPLKWRMGRIISLSPGKDGVSRVATIKTATGIIQRAFSKICPLPIPVPDDVSGLPDAVSQH